jgi:hypothetical protein
MTIVEQRHIVPKLSKRVFKVFVEYPYQSVRSVVDKSLISFRLKADVFAF